MDRLIQAGVAKDYFRSNDQQQENSADSEEPTLIAPVVAEAVANTMDDGQERVSVYDDDTMPYSFLWWLHKTRLEYADTYQPYVKSPLRPMTPSNDDIAKFMRSWIISYSINRSGKISFIYNRLKQS